MNHKHYGILFKKISNTQKMILDKELSQLGVTLVQGQVILYLWDNRDSDEINQRNLEEHLSLRGSTVANLLKRMEEHGLILRSRSGTDGRNNCLILTEKGTSILYGIHENIRKMEALIVADLTDQEKNQLLTLLLKVEKNMELAM